ncbi:MAG: glycoside hydrolase [Verrucomicrobia bacterium]|nr:glycoside hydrolase [Verrucomicrobiota bacterium]MBU1908613.1 glycoside hydrolase [Verrucomicrobiota bacterium]
MAFSAALVFLAGCATRPSITGLQVLARKGRPFVILKTDKALGWGVANHPILCRVSDKRIALSYWIAGDGAYSGTAPVSWPVYSDDQGKTWQFGDPYEWAGEKPPPEYSFIEAGTDFANYNFGYFMAAAQLPSSERIAHARYAVAGSPWTVAVVRSSDGIRWEGPVQAPINIPSDYPYQPAGLAFEQKAVVTPGGNILVTAYWNEPFLFESRNRGASYDLVSVVATKADAPWGTEGPCEPSLALLPNGELLCIMRTGAPWTGTGTAVAQPLLAARSKDGGRTWEYQKMPIVGVMPKLELMSNGVLALATGRPGNRLYFSTDGGRTWGREVVLTRLDGKTSGYCDILEVAPGRLLAVCDTMDTDMTGFWLWEPKEVNGIFGVFVNVMKLF